MKKTVSFTEPKSHSKNISANMRRHLQDITVDENRMSDHSEMQKSKTAHLSDLSSPEKAKITRLVNELMQLGKENAILTKELAKERNLKSSSHNNELEHQIMSIVKDNELLQRKYNDSLKLLHMYQDTIVQLAEKVNTVEVSKEEMLAKYLAVSNEYARLQSIADNQKRVIDTNITSKDELIEYQRKEQTLQKEIQELNEAFLRQEKRLLKSEQINSTLTQQFDDLLPQLAERTKQVSDLRERLYHYEKSSTLGYPYDGLMSGISSTINPYQANEVVEFQSFSAGQPTQIRSDPIPYATTSSRSSFDYGAPPSIPPSVTSSSNVALPTAPTPSSIDNTSTSRVLTASTAGPPPPPPPYPTVSDTTNLLPPDTETYHFQHSDSKYDLYRPHATSQTHASYSYHPSHPQNTNLALAAPSGPSISTSRYTLAPPPYTEAETESGRTALIVSLQNAHSSNGNKEKQSTVDVSTVDELNASHAFLRMSLDFDRRAPQHPQQPQQPQPQQAFGVSLSSNVTTPTSYIVTKSDLEDDNADIVEASVEQQTQESKMIEYQAYQVMDESGIGSTSDTSLYRGRSKVHFKEMTTNPHASKNVLSDITAGYIPWDAEQSQSVLGSDESRRIEHTPNGFTGIAYPPKSRIAISTKDVKLRSSQITPGEEGGGSTSVSQPVPGRNVGGGVAFRTESQHHRKHTTQMPVKPTRAVLVKDVKFVPKSTHVGKHAVSVSDGKRKSKREETRNEHENRTPEKKKITNHNESLVLSPGMEAWSAISNEYDDGSLYSDSLFDLVDSIETTSRGNKSKSSDGLYTSSAYFGYEHKGSDRDSTSNNSNSRKDSNNTDKEYQYTTSRSNKHRVIDMYHDLDINL